MEEKDAIVAGRIVQGLRESGIPEPFVGMFSLVVKGEWLREEFTNALELIDRSLDHRARAIELHKMLSQWQRATVQAQMIQTRLSRATRLWFEQFKLEVLACRVENIYTAATEIIEYAPYEVQRDVVVWVAKCMVEPTIVPESCAECHEVMRWDFDQKKLRCLSCERKRVVTLSVNDTPPCLECGSLMVRNDATSGYRCANCGATSG